MNVRIRPSVLRGTVEAISSKSCLHRQMICALLSRRETAIACRGLSRDVEATAQCARALGCAVELSETAIRLRPAERTADRPLLPCGESGSTARFLLPVAAAVTEGFSMAGEGRLPYRPMADLVRAMEENGCTISGDHLPLTVEGRLRSGTYRLPGDVSSQYVTGLLLALPNLDGDSAIELTTPLQSRAYVDITLEVLESFGVRVEKSGNGFFVPGNQAFTPPDGLRAEGDWSNAAFWFCAAAMGENRVEVTGLNGWSVQGDRAVVEVIRRMSQEGDLSIRVEEIPDLVPALSILACARRGKTTFTGAGRLRLKESDRIESCRRMVCALGGSAEAGPDSLSVLGSGALRCGTVDGCGDHRIVMAAAIGSLLCSGDVTVMGAEAVNKSYPQFFADFRALGGIVDDIL
ncbi:3-phosphoshikimate 1-carboxyvinyltransferase [Oscillibacter hominis]|uniref:3-phosphoshikimate 1-carboxyvinyltransferase n=1 Tax=Oscillibacter hominis TaxID=2763056 RepID=A0A7G9B420_9FIRM|nr:3-phosphoshikimate 1-carboxyvinyltransferase [Oscillibacter hominis]QNL44301.1 3-phosphoshikimate 1-carboxyvinyltransferase [Oscillibacter hominis]